MSLVYKIRDSATGLYSNGNVYTKYSSAGKIWIGTGPLRNHLNQYIKMRKQPLPETWEVVTMELTEKEFTAVKFFYANKRKRSKQTSQTTLGSIPCDVRPDALEKALGRHFGRDLRTG